MYYQSEFTWEQASALVNNLILEVTLKHLSDGEVQVLRGSWEGKTYNAIASEYHLSRRRIEEIGEDLWNKLSNALGEQVKKTNFRQALQRQWHKSTLPISNTFVKPSPPQKQATIKAIDLYQERFPIEIRCYQQICQPGALLRIKAPLQMGKTELMSKVMHHAQQQGYRTVVLNLWYASKEDFSNLDKFLQWFITSIALELDLLQQVEKYWKRSHHNSKIKCRKCFERYLLPADKPLAIALDEVDRLLPYQEIAAEFLGMLRTWHEEAKTSELWAQLRLVKLHTEVYTHLNINQSPFNAGYEIKLKDFNRQEVQYLALKYGLQWDNSQVEQLMAMVGGHPYLVVKALQIIAGQEMSLEQLLQTAPTASSIYRNYLERLWQQLQSNLQLNQAFQMIMLADAPLEFNSQLNLDDAVKLYDLGLVELQNNHAMPRYELYRQYFRKRLKAGSGNAGRWS
ncbi:AAA-like domain-containing protein [Scytonema sp. PCC 10023]|uniref:AAA-like domain-containing protein n=1 Tax=Scytonema sp. PCC 10023 TaxID=1680591 RepID=UPI0039C639AE